jgi:hypothetical protein
MTARGVILLCLLVVGAVGCSTSRTATRTIEVEADADVAFRAAAATLLDDRQVFKLSDRDAGLVGGMRHSTNGLLLPQRVTFWVTPLPADRSFVLVQVYQQVSQSDAQLQERLDWLIGRFRQRCLLGGDVTPLEDAAETEGGAT